MSNFVNLEAVSWLKHSGPSIIYKILNYSKTFKVQIFWEGHKKFSQFYLSVNFEMSFWCLEFSQKTNENNSTWVTIVVKSNFFVHSLGELKKIPKRPFEINWPLSRFKPNWEIFSVFCCLLRIFKIYCHLNLDIESLAVLHKLQPTSIFFDRVPKYWATGNLSKKMKVEVIRQEENASWNNFWKDYFKFITKICRLIKPFPSPLKIFWNIKIQKRKKQLENLKKILSCPLWIFFFQNEPTRSNVAIGWQARNTRKTIWSFFLLLHCHN